MLAVSHPIILTICTLSSLSLAFLLSSSTVCCGSEQTVLFGKTVCSAVPGLHDQAASLIPGVTHTPQKVDLSHRHASQI